MKSGGFALDDNLELPLLRGERLAGRLLTRLVVTAGLLTVLVVLAGAALAWLGIWQPLVASVVMLVMAAISWRVSAVVPTRALPVWTALALLVISLGATTWAGLTHDEVLLPRGEAGMFWVSPLFAGLLVLVVGLLTSSVVGPRWGPLGAFATLAYFPLLHAARATYADVIVLFIFCTGLLLLVAATRAGARGRTQLAQAVGFLAGALVASGSLFRPQAVGQTVLLLPVAALLVIRRQGAGAPLLWGAGVATGLSALVGLGLSGSWLQEQGSSLISLGLLAVGLALLSLTMVVLARRGTRVPDGARAVLPPLAGALVVFGGLALMPLPSRQALVWTAWWTGPYALVVTLVIVAVGVHNLTRAWFRGEQLPAWFGALVVGLGAGLLHWRSLAVPLVVVCVAAATAWVTRWSTRHLPAVAAVMVSVGTAATLLVPAVAANCCR